jgi:hypothetical protein
MYGIFFLYDGANPPKGAFGKFEQIEATVDLVKRQTYTEMVSKIFQAQLSLY